MASTTGIVAKYGQKAAGVYREIIDETATSIATSTTNVVIVIQSEQGPIMKPIYCEDADTLHAIFGTRNAKLESKGNYGILMAEHVLEAGPVWILNIKNINANRETVDVIKLACNNADTEAFAKETINTVYDTTKFWNIDPMYGTHGDDAMLSFAAVANGTVTVVVTKYVDSDKRYNYTVKETKQYNADFLGEGLDDDAYVSDYLIQVDVFKTNLASASISTTGAIVNGRVNVDKLAALREDAGAKFYKTYVGSVGNVIDKSGNNLSIVSLINADYLKSGLWCALNTDDVNTNGIDLLGITSIVPANASSDESDAESDEESGIHCKQIKRLGELITPTLTEYAAMIPITAANTAYFKNSAPSVSDVIAVGDMTARVAKVDFIGNEYNLDSAMLQKLGTIEAPIQPNGQPFEKLNGVFVYPATAPASVAGTPLVESNGNILHYYEDFNLVNATWYVDNNVPSTLIDARIVLSLYSDSTGPIDIESGALDQMTSEAWLADLQLKLNTAIKDCTFTVAFVDDTIEICTSAVNVGVNAVMLSKAVLHAYLPDYGHKTWDLNATDTDQAASNIATVKSTPILVASGYHTQAAYTVSTDVTDAKDVDMDAVSEAFGDATKVFLATFDRPLVYESTEDEHEPAEAEPAEAEPAEDEHESVVSILGKNIVVDYATIYRLNAWYEALASVNMHVATGIKSLESHYVNGTVARQESILDMLNTTGMTNAFSDKTVFKCRYMVDTFKTYIAPNQKNQYAKLAAASCRFLAFIPSPFFYELRTSKNPSFYDLLGNFKMSYVKLGSNPDVPSTNSFSYTTDADGAKFIVPVMNVTYNDGFADKVVPATGLIAKYFYIKHLGAHKVYDIVAGQDWPLSAAGVTGPEFVAGQDERAAMEQMGTNVLQKIDGVLQLRSNRTAFQNVLSACNYPETMEKVLYVQDYVEPTLDGKLFKYNNADTRLQVKLMADEACDQMVADGVIGSYNNICDLTNNPTDVRQAGIIMLDTELYNEYGIRIAVHRVTIKNTND